jgi:Ser/Thr protein kinase RdoA (MazF antagonist)
VTGNENDAGRDARPATGQDDERILSGGSEHHRTVVRIGDTVHRPRTSGYEVVEAMLTHLEEVGFEGSPRFLGVDRHGRQMLEYLPGTAHRSPPWQHDDAANAAQLGRLAAWLRRLHDATAHFTPPVGSSPQRALPLPGEVWTHGDVGYPNVVYQADRLVGLIDWEFAAPAHRCCDPAALLAVSVRGPRPDADDNTRRAHATRLAVETIARGHDMTDAEVRALPAMAATVLDDAVAFRAASMGDDERDRYLWRSRWLRENAEHLSAG